MGKLVRWDSKEVLALRAARIGLRLHRIAGGWRVTGHGGEQVFARLRSKQSPTQLPQSVEALVWLLEKEPAQRRFWAIWTRRQGDAS